MVRKKLAMAVLTISALQAGLVSALGLGNLSVQSALNQPLNAEIKLLDTGDLDPSQIKVQLAAPEDFERAGVDRNFFLTNLKFAVDLDGRGSGTIRITTHDSVAEPYLNFVVEAKWPSGRLLREFAVLLDPPTFSGGAAQAAVAPRASGALAPRPAPTPTPTPAPTRELQPPTVGTEPAASSTAERIESNTLPDAGSATEHRVQVNETLSQIAAQHRPGAATVQQTMVAIQRANPDAFINSNINLIKSGAVLRLPSADDADAVGAAEAARQIAEQTHSWRSGGAGGEPATGPQLDASQSETAATGGSQDAERLTIATPGNSDKSTVGEGSGKNTKGLEALRNQLSASQEGLDSAKRDNKELQSRLDDMERQVATLQRLIALKDDQLAAVQAKSAAQVKTPAAAAAPAVPAESVAAQPAPEASVPAAATPAEAPPAVATVPKPVPKPVAKPVTKAPAPPEPSLLDKLTSEPLYWGGALAALALLLGGGALAAKKRREQAEAETAYQELDLQDYTDTPLAADDDLDTASISDDAIVPAGAAQPMAEPEKKPATRPETGDALAEADIYIAYGRYQQAVDLLTGAIEAEPARTDLRLKLLEVFLEMRNRDAFRQQVVALQDLGDNAAIGQVKEMLSSVDGVSDWLDDLPQSGGSTGGDLAAAGVVTGAAAAAAAHSFAQSSELDDELTLDDDLTLDDHELDLDLDLQDETPVPNAEFAAAPLTELPTEPLEELELDLDLEGDDLDLPGIDAFAGNGSEAPAPAYDPFSSGQPEFTSADALMDLELDEEELDLELNEDDLDFALRAMEGDKSDMPDPVVPAFDAGAETSSFAAPDFEASNFEASHLEASNLETPDFETPDFEIPGFESASFETPNVETPNFQTTNFETTNFESADFESPDFEAPAVAAADDEPEIFSLDDELEPVAAAPKPASDLQDFDLSLAADEFKAEIDFGALETGKREEDLDDFEGLGELDDLGFDAPSFESPVADEPAFAAPVEPAPAPELTAAVGDDFDFLADTDEVATKLDLARAYIDMGDSDGARDILDEVLQEGSDVQKQEASELLGRMA